MYKIIYHVGASIDGSTIVKKGKLNIDDRTIESSEGLISLENISSVELYKLNGLGTMIKLQANGLTIYLAVYRLFINVSTGFAIINYFKKKKYISS